MNRKKLLLLKKQNKLDNKPIDKETLVKQLQKPKAKANKPKTLPERFEHVHNAYSDKRFYFEAPKLGLGIRTKKGFKVFSKTEKNSYLCTNLVTFREVRVEGIKYIVPHHIFRANPVYKTELVQYEKERSRAQGSGPRSKPKPSLCTKHPDWGRFRSATNYFARGKVPLGKCTTKDGVGVFKEYIPNPYPDKPHEGNEGEGVDADEKDGDVYVDSDYYDSEYEEEEADYDTTSQFSGTTDESWYDEDMQRADAIDEYTNEDGANLIDDDDQGPTGNPLHIIGINR